MINLCVNEDKKFQRSSINDYIRCTIAIGVFLGVFLFDVYYVKKFHFK